MIFQGRFLQQIVLFYADLLVSNSDVSPFGGEAAYSRSIAPYMLKKKISHLCQNQTLNLIFGTKIMLIDQDCLWSVSNEKQSTHIY